MLPAPSDGTSGEELALVQGLPHLACPTPSLQWWGNRRGGWPRGQRLGVSRLGVRPCASGSIQSLPRHPSSIPPPPWKQSSSWCRSEHVSLLLLEPSVTRIVFRTSPSAWSRPFLHARPRLRPSLPRTLYKVPQTHPALLGLWAFTEAVPSA